MLAEEQGRAEVVEELKTAVFVNAEGIHACVARHGRQCLQWMDYRLGMPAMYYAVTHIDSEAAVALTQQLVELGSPLDFTDLWSSNWLFYCAQDSQVDIFSMLVKRGVDPNQPNVYSQTVLFLLAQRGSVKILRFLLRNRDKIAVDVNATDELGRNALFYAAEAGHQQACRLLLALGSEFLKDGSKHYAMHYARKMGFEEVCGFLTYHKDRKRKRKAKKVRYGGVNDSEEPEYYHLSLIKEDLQARSLTISEVVHFLQNNEEVAELIQEFEEHCWLDQSVEESWQSRAMGTVQSCLRVKGAGFFEEPVDEEEYGIHGYYETILNPMDFGTISRKLSHNAYASAGEFAEDVELIARNCLQFNGEGHEISKYALRVLAHFRKVWLEGSYD